MFCNNCGNQIPDNSAFCPNCGAAFSQPQQPVYQQPQQPQYGQPQYGQPQYGQPQYGQPQYGQPQYGQPGGYMPPQKPAEEPGKGMAIASLVLGILSFFCFAYVSGILAIIFGCVAKNKGYQGKMATAGIICGAIGIVLMIVFQILGFSLLGSMGYYY